MKKWLLLGLSAVMVVLAIASFLLFRPPPARNFPDAKFSASIAIAPLAEALTFARTIDEGELQLFAVVKYEDDHIAGINITNILDERVADPVTLFRKAGYEQLAGEIESKLEGSLTTIDVADLIVPLELGDSHVAAGTNFAAHAEEADVVDGPFLFPKLVTPTPSGSSVKVGDALLDYEVELAFVTLADVELPDVPQYMGLILANDVTDRATLMRHLNPDDVTSGDGFATGKSSKGYLPVGDLFVIPRDLREFVASTQLQLAVNGRLRQSAPMSQAIWDIDELLRQIQVREEVRWDHLGKEVGLPVDDCILPERTLILSGTPEGTAFAGISTQAMAWGAVYWISGGWEQSIKKHVVESYVETAVQRQEYLRTGDAVEIQVDQMGRINTSIE